MRSMASANMGATEMYLILLQPSPIVSGMVFRRATSLITLLFRRSSAGPDSTPWLALDSLMEKENFKLTKLRFKAWTGILERNGNKILVMKPQTYMNLSGEAVGEAARFYKVPADHVVVISDDVSLPVGKLRIRKSGSAGGHNGLKNIIQHLGTDGFPRIKVGVGMPEHPDHEMIDWVIGKPQGEEAKTLRAALDRAAEAALCIVDEGADRAMNRFN